MTQVVAKRDSLTSWHSIKKLAFFPAPSFPPSSPPVFLEYHYRPMDAFLFKVLSSVTIIILSGAHIVPHCPANPFYPVPLSLSVAPLAFVLPCFLTQGIFFVPFQ